MRFVPALPLAVALLSTAATAQPPRGEVYRATGTEPFWSLMIDRQLMRYQPAGGPPVVVRTPRVINGFAGEMYQTPRLSVNIIHKACSDGMSDRTYRDTVDVRTRRGTVRGCGGGVIEERPGASLADTRWTVETVNGRPIQTYDPLTVRFARDRIEGKLCNAFGGDYTLRGDRLSADRIISTKMACQGPAQVAETVVFRMLERPVRIAIDRRDVLTISGGPDTVTLRRDRR